jgi:hypothetical protein
MTVMMEWGENSHIEKHVLDGTRQRISEVPCFDHNSKWAILIHICTINKRILDQETLKRYYVLALSFYYEHSQ